MSRLRGRAGDAADIAYMHLRETVQAEKETANDEKESYLACFKHPHLRRTFIVAFAEVIPLFFGLRTFIIPQRSDVLVTLLTFVLRAYRVVRQRKLLSPADWHGLYAELALASRWDRYRHHRQLCDLLHFLEVQSTNPASHWVDSNLRDVVRSRSLGYLAERGRNVVSSVRRMSVML